MSLNKELFNNLPQEINMLISEFIPVKINYNYRYKGEKQHDKDNIISKIEDRQWNVQDIKELEKLHFKYVSYLYGTMKFADDANYCFETYITWEEKYKILKEYERDMNLYDYVIEEIKQLLTRLYRIRNMRKLGINSNGKYNIMEKIEPVNEIKTDNYIDSHNNSNDYIDSDSEDYIESD